MEQHVDQLFDGSHLQTFSVKPEDDDPDLRAFAEKLRAALPV